MLCIKIMTIRLIILVYISKNKHINSITYESKTIRLSHIKATTSTNWNYPVTTWLATVLYQCKCKINSRGKNSRKTMVPFTGVNANPTWFKLPPFWIGGLSEPLVYAISLGLGLQGRTPFILISLINFVQSQYY